MIEIMPRLADARNPGRPGYSLSPKLQVIGQRVIADRFDGQLGDALLDFRALDLEDRAFRARHASPLASCASVRSSVNSSADRSISSSAILRAKSSVSTSGSPSIGFGACRSPSAARRGALGARDAGNAPSVRARAGIWRRSSPCSLRRCGFSTGTFTLSKKTSFTSCAPSSTMIGFTVMPGDLHVDEQEGDAFLRLHIGVGAHEAEDPVGILRQRGPGLLAVDDIVIAFAHARAS